MDPEIQAAKKRTWFTKAFEEGHYQRPRPELRTFCQQITATVTGSTVRLFALGSDGRVYQNDGDFTAGHWDGFGLVDGTAGFQQITATPSA